MSQIIWVHDTIQPVLCILAFNCGCGGVVGRFDNRSGIVWPRHVPVGKNCFHATNGRIKAEMQATFAASASGLQPSVPVAIFYEYNNRKWHAGPANTSVLPDGIQ
jgi:hypothetical protein